MLLGLVIWPYLSDRDYIGRKRVIVGSLTGVGTGLALQAASLAANWPLWAFLGLRVLSGAAAGASPVTKAYLADLATPDELPQWLAYREATCALAFIIGPALGGLVFFSSASLAAVVGVTAAGSLGAAAIVATLVEKSPLRREARVRPTLYADAGASCPLGARVTVAVATIVAVSALENAGASSWDAFGALMLQQRFGLDARGVGLLFTSLAGISLATSAFGFNLVRQSFGIVATSVIGLLLIAAGLGGIGASTTSLGGFCAATALYQLGKPLYAPTVPTLLLSCVPPHRRGLALGAEAFVSTLSRAIAPVVLGAVMQRSGSQKALSLAAGLVAAAAGIAAIRGVQVAQNNRAIRLNE